MTREQLLELGFKELPHFTINKSLQYNLGRNKVLSIGSIGTPNEMIFLCEMDTEDNKKCNDLIVLRNYDYDGYTTLEEVKLIIKALITKDK
jgi:hypothetical protein